MPRLLACLTLVLALVPRGAAAQWASIGNMPRPTASGDTVTFRNSQGVVAVTAVAPDIVRVRFVIFLLATLCLLGLTTHAALRLILGH